MKKLLSLFLLVLCFFTLTACGEKVEYVAFEGAKLDSVEGIIVEVRNISNEGVTVALWNDSDVEITRMAWFDYYLVDMDGAWYSIERVQSHFDRIEVDDGDPKKIAAANFTLTPGNSKEVPITFSSTYGVDTMPNGNYRVGVSYNIAPESPNALPEGPRYVSWADFVIE